MEPDADVSSGIDLRRFRVVSALRLASQVIISGQFECYRLIASTMAQVEELLTPLDVLNRSKSARVVGLNLAIFCLKPNAVPSIF